MRENEQPVPITVNGQPVTVTSNTTVAAAVLMVSVHARTSVRGELRAPLCGMGICFECRVTIDGKEQQRSCQILCAPGMDVRTS